MGKDAVQGFYAKIPNAAATDSTKTRFVVPCDTQMTLMFTFAGHQFTLDPRDTVIRDASNTTKCYGVVLKHFEGWSIVFVISINYVPGLIHFLQIFC